MNILRRVSSIFGALFPQGIVLLAVLEADPMKFSIKTGFLSEQNTVMNLQWRIMDFNELFGWIPEL